MRSDEMPEPYRWRMLLWLGPHRHVLLYPLRHAAHTESVHSLSAFVPVAEVQRESWSASGNLDDLRRSLAGACEGVLELLECMNGALITGIYFRDPLERWGTGRVVLLGDAAHPAPPSAGQGAGMALEDAVMLAACLRRHGPGAVAAGLREYELRRSPRTVRMLESSRVNLLYSQVSDPVGVHARDGYYRGLRRLSDIGSPMGRGCSATTRSRPPSPPTATAGRHASRCGRRRGGPSPPGARRSARSTARAAGAASARGSSSSCCASSLRRGGRPVDCDGVPAIAVGEGMEVAGSPVVLHLHGGGYVLGSAACSTALAARLAAALGGWALVVDYRLAPEHPAPAALEDALAAYRWLASARPQASIFVTGECACGGLAVALARALLDAGEQPPSAIFAASPFCDLSISERGFDFCAGNDPWLDRILATQLAACYIQDSDPASPEISPLFADPRGLPPMMIAAAREEAMFRSAAGLAERARAGGVEVAFEAVADSVHSFVLFGDLPEAQRLPAAFASFALAAARRR